jgi:hypothetical protein
VRHEVRAASLQKILLQDLCMYIYKWRKAGGIFLFNLMKICLFGISNISQIRIFQEATLASSWFDERNSRAQYFAMVFNSNEEKQLHNLLI